MPFVIAPGFGARAHQRGDDLWARLEGVAATHALEVLKSFLPALHAEARRRRVHQVVVDLTTLDFLSSSCFKAFVAWLRCVREAPPDEQYRVRFLSTPKHHWQARSLPALRFFAVGLVEVELCPADLAVHSDHNEG